MTIKIDVSEPNIFPDVEDLDARDAGRHVELFLDVRIEGKHTPVTVKLSYEQASDLAILLEPFRKPFFDRAGQLLTTRLNVTHHQAPIYALTLGSFLVDSLADPFNHSFQRVDFRREIIVDRPFGQNHAIGSFTNRRSTSIVTLSRSIQLSLPRVRRRLCLRRHPLALRRSMQPTVP